MQAIYRAILWLFAPLFALAVLWRIARGREPRAAWAERFGRMAAQGGSGPVIWCHAASVGEVTSIRWVLEGLLAARDDLHILLTCNTATARQMAKGWGLARMTVAFAPYDTAGPVGRVLAAWQPAGLVIAENELWPSRIAAARRAKIPVLVIGARLSSRSAARWARLPGLVQPMLKAISWVSAQDILSDERLRRLGLSEGRLGPILDLKAEAEVVAPASPMQGREAVLLAASTHEGEDDLILDAFLASGRFDRLILAPRHPERADDVAKAIALRGVPFARRSKGASPAGEKVFLADTLGEMALWYAAAGTCIIGGSFVAKRGHNPYEPGRAGMALIHGPSVENFGVIFARLDATGGAMRAEPGELTAILSEMTPDKQAAMGAKAAASLARSGKGGWIVGEILQRIGIGV